MSPTVLRAKGYRFFFFSLEEDRMHVHVACADGDAKFWLEPAIEYAMSRGLAPHQLTEIRQIIEENHHEFADHWRTHFDT